MRTVSIYVIEMDNMMMCSLSGSSPEAYGA